MKNRIKSLLDKCILTTTPYRLGTTTIPLQTTNNLSMQMLNPHHAAPISSSTGPSLEKMKAKKSHNIEWRKKQLDLLKQKFHPHKATTATTNVMTHEEEDDDDDDGQQQLHTSAAETMIVQHDDDLQPMWKQMESRVKNRPTRSMEENQGRSGRENVKQTDEDEWLRAGLYNNGDNSGGDSDGNGGSINGGGAAAKSDR